MGYIRADWSLFLPAPLKKPFTLHRTMGIMGIERREGKGKQKCSPAVCLGLAILHANKGGWLAGRGETRTSMFSLSNMIDQSEK